MKHQLVIISFFVLSLFFFQNCQPIASLQIETIVPAEIDFPGNFNKIIFVNFENDINDDQEIDTLLYHMITREMNIGFLDALKLSTGIDSTDFFYVRGFPQSNQLYQLDTISWDYLEKISGQTNADIFIILDSMKLSMQSEFKTDYYSEPTEYYKYREFSVNAYWSVFDLVERKRLDAFHYKDTLLWDAVGYSKIEVERRMPSLEKSIKEISYFAALDYANRIFPGWQTERRYYFINGNKDFKKAALLVQENNWTDASEIWTSYSNDLDKEIASRACFNLALASEMMGKLSLAIAWAEKSNEVKSKTRTQYYIQILKNRKVNLEKLQKQVY